MRTFILFLILLGSLSFQGKLRPFPEQYLSFQEYCQYFGYQTEKHEIVTSDGHILNFFRIQKDTFQQGLKPIYLQHGLLDSSDTFIVNYEHQAPAFVLVNAGYDVWLGNTRGNKYSKGHKNLDPKSREFWDFTWSQMADYDLPAGFKYIAEVTGQEKIDYVGHSQGTLIMYAALSQKDETIQRYLGKFIALAPIVSMRHQNSTVLTTLQTINKFEFVLDDLGIFQVLSSNKPLSHVTASVCALIQIVCSQGLKLFSDLEPSVDNIERLPVVMGHYPSGASTQDLQHFNQMIAYNEFSLKRYDYGNKKNILKYGTPTPPIYDLKNIKADLYLFHGNYDLLADMHDVNDLIDLLKQENPTLVSKKYDAGHATFIWGQNDQIMKDLLSALRGEL